MNLGRHFKLGLRVFLFLIHLLFYVGVALIPLQLAAVGFAISVLDDPEAIRPYYDVVLLIASIPLVGYFFPSLLHKYFPEGSVPRPAKPTKRSSRVMCSSSQ